MESPPPKWEGACSNAPIPKLLNSPQSNSGVSIAQHVCRRGTTRVELMPQGHKHYAMETCAICRCFVRWLPKPETVQRQQLNAFRLARLAMHPGLSDWERNFLRDISQRRKLSPKQQQIIDRLCADYLEAKPS